MAQPNPPKSAQPKPATSSKKRKEPPASSNAPNSGSKKQKTSHGAKQRNARTLSTQTTSKAFANGALDVDAFVKAREFEMRALDASMQRSKKALNRRAFQQVPKELRRRTASHNVKRIPKRLRERGKKEMIEDNTPTVTARRRKPTRHMRVRLETIKRLRALGAEKKAATEKAQVEQSTVAGQNSVKQPAVTQDNSTSTNVAAVTTRKPRIKKAALSKPTTPKAKFRKRQVCKSWLPTHLFHAKRAHMTPPSAPLWRFAIPLTPTQKSYRPTHRASHERGAVAWDTSYMATIGLEGEQRSIEVLLKALGVGRSDSSVWGGKGEKWRKGLRVQQTFAFEQEAPPRLIAPFSIVWCAESSSEDASTESMHRRRRKLFLRVHPSAFYELWEEVVRLSKVAKPALKVEDLRFEIGSIEIGGPGSTEALLGALWPTASTSNAADTSPSGSGDTWTALAGVTDPSVLPSGALLAFTVQDPRLHHPPRTIKLPKSDNQHAQLLELIAKWPVDQTQKTAQIFDKTKRLRGSKLSSQKAINRRRSVANPGEDPAPLATDPQIPILAHTSTSHAATGKRQNQASWTVLAPWKTIQPIWYSLVYYPLSTGQQPRFGGLREQQQLAFEARRPWFPADYPGTKAGWDWEVVERRRRWEEWSKRPKSKRTTWEKVDLGNGKKGEVGEGWSCDWSLLLNMAEEASTITGNEISTSHDGQATTSSEEQQQPVAPQPPKPPEPPQPPEPPKPPSKPGKLTQLSPDEARRQLNGNTKDSPASDSDGNLITVRINLINRGVPQTCARVYRLPAAESETKLRKAWLDLEKPSGQHHRGPTHSQSRHSLPKLPKDAPAHVVQQRLAQSLLQSPHAGEDTYPACPGAEDLIGFVTTGNFNLAEGQGTGIGSLLLEKVVNEARQKGSEGRLCIVRNAGADVGRLARWEIAT